LQVFELYLLSCQSVHWVFLFHSDFLPLNYQVEY
jgi:hypothetical protein